MAEKANDLIIGKKELALFSLFLLANGKCYQIADISEEYSSKHSITLGCKDANPTANVIPPKLDYGDTVKFYGNEYRIVGINTTGWSSHINIYLKNGGC